MRSLAGKIVIIFVVVLAIAAGVWLYLNPQQSANYPFGFSQDAKVLDLSNRDLDSLPAEIGNYTQAEELLLDNNKLTGALPAEIRKLSKLTKISARNNNLTGIPAEIGQLKNLREIDFSGNQISTYPQELWNLQQGLAIDLSGNPFTASQIAELKAKMPDAEIRF